MPFFVPFVAIKAVSAIVTGAAHVLAAAAKVVNTGLDKTIGSKATKGVDQAADNVNRAYNSPQATAVRAANDMTTSDKSKQSDKTDENPELTDKEKHDQEKHDEALKKLEDSLRDLELTTFGEDFKPIGVDIKEPDAKARFEQSTEAFDDNVSNIINRCEQGGYVNNVNQALKNVHKTLEQDTLRSLKSNVNEKSKELLRRLDHVKAHLSEAQKQVKNNKDQSSIHFGINP